MGVDALRKLSQESTGLILASASAGRRALLAQLGLKFEVVASGAEEHLEGTGPEKSATDLAIMKAQRVEARRPGGLIIGADTLIWLDGKPIGKPLDRSSHLGMLRELSGRWHEVWSGVALALRGSIFCAGSCTRVRLRTLSAEEITRYLERGEGSGRAGGYALQGSGTILIRELQGDPNNVIGLPVQTLLDLAASAQVQAGSSG